ncbi:hypothetical protein ACFOW1_12230 [Parasediminibacterium paludis]|uniref:Uncharacterized protein n=1 Tax=Parasediminibacterium paludis TaxID=908966 RepID=A0ABV8Q141_9BACT
MSTTGNKQLDNILQTSDEFYMCEAMQRLIAHEYGENCFQLVCYDMSCGCEQVDRCDLNEGETIKSLYPEAIEISLDDFKAQFIACVNKRNNL